MSKQKIIKLKFKKVKYNCKVQLEKITWKEIKYKKKTRILKNARIHKLCHIYDMNLWYNNIYFILNFLNYFFERSWLIYIITLLFITDVN